MGLRASIESLGPDRDFDARLVFLEFESINRLPEAVVYKFNVRYQRYTWYIIKRFSEFKKLDGLLRTQFPNQMSTIPMPKKFSKMFWSHSDQFLRTRGENLKKYMTLVLDYLGADIFYSVALKQFFEIGPTSFRSEMGRKGKEGFLQKSSGGYLTNFSSTLGDYFKFWNTRYIVVHDNHIAYYKSYEDEYPSGSLQIDQGLQVWANGRLINVRTLTRRLILFASSKREAEEWRVALEEFYAGAVRRLPHKFGSAYAPRPHCPVRLYGCGQDYFGAVTAALLSAQKEIYIASWMVSPLVWLTRPPAPPIRLDQLLKYKAEQGVNIYVLLYQEVEMAKQGNDSNRCKNILESLYPSRIFVIRHPNKLVGGSTALLWSHHEKIVVVDRTAAFLGGIDLAFGRYDNAEHRLTDEDGWRFPGGDYYQPGEGHFNPVPGLGIAPVDRALPKSEEVVAEFVSPSNTVGAPTPSVSASVLPYSGQITHTAVPPRLPKPNGLSMAPAVRFPPPAARENDDTDSVDSVSDLGDDYQEPLQEEELKALQEAAREEMQEAPPPVGPQMLSGEDLPVASVVYEAPIAETERETIASTATGAAEKDADRKEKKKAWNLDSILEAISGFGDAVVKGTGSKCNAGEVAITLRQRRGTTRDMFPRMPWHDIHAYVGGLAARDISSHFIQRWNHHRLSKGSNKACVFTEITDNPIFGVCAKCQLPNISQEHRICPRCYHDLGSRGYYFDMDSVDADGHPTMRLPKSDIPPYIVFKCTFDSKLGCRIQGTGPVLVTSILDPDLVNNMPEGILLHEHSGGVPDFKASELAVNSAVASPAAVLYCASALPTATVSTVTHSTAAGVVQGQVLSVKHAKPAPATRPSPLAAPNVKPSFPDVDVVPVLSLDIAGLVPDTPWKDTKVSTFSAEVDDLNRKQRTFKPKVGDILESVNGVPVGHMDFSQVQRLILRHKFLQEIENRSSVKRQSTQLVVVFKRFFVNDVAEIRTHDSETMDNVRLYGTTADSPIGCAGTLDAPDDPRLVMLHSAPSKVSPPKPVVSRIRPCASSTGDLSTASSSEQLAPSAADASAASLQQCPGSLTTGSLSTLNPFDEPESPIGNCSIISRDTRTRTNTTTSTISGSRQLTPMDQYIRDRALEKKSLICRTTTTRELDYRVLALFNNRKHFINQDVLGELSHTCQIQVLRSVGTWSVGQRTEKSIYECWRDTIAGATQFVYIENQFFLSSLSSNSVQNSLAQVLLDKLVSAANDGRVFRAVIIIPLHPEGDFLNAAPVRHVMHFQYSTICRGAKSLIEQFKKRAPSAVVSDYISFFSLRNWGVLNGEVVTDQIYVHDKLLIVDDRVIVMGSANFNDRSMLGERDSEMAIRIEDTAHKAIRMNGHPFYVGVLPHKLRTTLMKRHLGDASIDISDPVCVATYYNILVRTAVQNSNIYSALDGPLSSFDRAHTLSQFMEGLLQARALQATDESVKTLLESIVGQIVMYPLDFLKLEDLGPSLASKTVVPTELWV